LLSANHDGEWVSIKVGRKETEVWVEPGQFIFGRFSAAKKLKMSPSTSWKRIKKLENIGNLNIKSDINYSLITIIKWDTYQGSKNKGDIKGDSRVTAVGQPRNTNKNDKNEKKPLKGSKKTDPRVKVFIDWFANIFEKKFKMKYVVTNGAKTGSQVKNLLRSNLTFEELQLKALMFFTDEDEWLDDKSRDMGMFMSRLNKYKLNEIKNKPTIKKYLINENGEPLHG